MTRIDLFDDLCTLTGVSKLSLQNLSDKGVSCISHGIIECIQNTDAQCEIDIGIGILYIKLEEEAIKYKFIPSKNLEETVAFAVKYKASPIALKADKALGDRIENAYRSLI